MGDEEGSENVGEEMRVPGMRNELGSEIEGNEGRGKSPKMKEK